MKIASLFSKEERTIEKNLNQECLIPQKFERQENLTTYFSNYALLSINKTL